MHTYNDYRYADCIIMYAFGVWRAYYQAKLVCDASSVTKMNAKLKAMKLAKEGPWA